MTDKQAAGYVGKYLAKSKALSLGDAVRVYFGGGESRDGTLEHIAENDKLHVRLSPGWVHLCDASDLLLIRAGMPA